MAHKRGGGSAKNGRDSPGKRLGVKACGSEFVTAGSIIVRQRGTKFLPGVNVGRAKDDTLFACARGVVKFEFARGGRRQVSVLPTASAGSGSPGKLQ